MSANVNSDGVEGTSEDAALVTNFDRSEKLARTLTGAALASVGICDGSNETGHMKIGNFNLQFTNPLKGTSATSSAKAAAAPPQAGDHFESSGSAKASPAQSTNPLQGAKKWGSIATVGGLALVGAQVGGHVAAALSSFLSPVISLGVGLAVFQGKSIKINDRQLRDVLSPFKPNEADSSSTATLKKVANFGLRAGVSVAAGSLAGALVPFAGLVLGGIVGLNLGKVAARHLFQADAAKPPDRPQSS